MPRADPTRSDYCASRHLLRNLGDAAELARNPLARPYFSSDVNDTPRRDADADRHVLDGIRDDVRRALARCSEFTRGGTHVALGRMHAALLRCDIDDAPLPAVAAELGLSERQLRRERRAAHAAFAGAFRTVHREAGPPATACDVVTVRLAEAVELHELGQGAVAQSELASIASGADSPARRIEALCLAAELELDALRHTAAAAHLAEARTIAVLHARCLDDDAARAADEHLEFVAWLVRWLAGTCAGLTARPPIVLAAPGDVRAHAERRRALFVRAAAAYATQRWEVGDGVNGCAAAARGWNVMSTLGAARTKERLALMMADAHLYGLHAPRGADRHHFHTVERLAAAHGHVHSLLLARAQRIAGAAAVGPGASDRICEPILGPFGAGDRRSMARAFASAAGIAAGCESNDRDAVESAKLAERTVPLRSAPGLMARHIRAHVALEARRYEEAAPLMQSVYADAKLAGNGRVLGAAARSLSAIALGCRRRAEAQRYIREALSLGERFASPHALARTHALARRLDVA
jgi:hypothetical protein